MAQGDYFPLYFDDCTPIGTYWQRPLVDTTSITISVCPICGYWKSTDGTVKCHCGYPPTPLETHEIIWCETD